MNSKMVTVFIITLLITLIHPSKVYAEGYPIVYSDTRTINHRAERLHKQRSQSKSTHGRHQRATSSRGPRDQRPGETLADYCRRACAEGRGTSREAYIYCGGCNAYSDEASSEYRDFPF